jgi:hypothetical protein
MEKRSLCDGPPSDVDADDDVDDRNVGGLSAGQRLEVKYPARNPTAMANTAVTTMAHANVPWVYTGTVSGWWDGCERG